MPPRALFGVVVRTAAFLACLYGAYMLVALSWRMFVLVTFNDFVRYTVLQFLLDLAPGFGWIAGGLLVLLRADRIARFAYRGRRAGTCENCGYDLRGSPGRCPECGTTVIPPGSV